MAVSEGQDWTARPRFRDRLAAIRSVFDLRRLVPVVLLEHFDQ